MSIRIIQGDCVCLMRTLAENSVDAVVTDPPYGIRFMGQAWDGADIEARVARRRAAASSDPSATALGSHKSLAAEAGKYDLSPAGMLAFQEFSAEWALEALRVLKPGGHLLSFASARTYHRMACGIESVGFEIRDQIMWLYGSGFPKSHNGEWGGTALKPAHEPIVMARKPLIGTVEANWREHGTGALNIDACRIEAEPMPPNIGKGAMLRRTVDDVREPRPPAQPHELGRWPANLLHDGSEEVVAAFPDAPGQLADASASASDRKTQNVYGPMRRGRGDELSANSENNGEVGFKMRPGARRLDAGSAARFFYCAKANKADRNDGCEGLPLKQSGMVSNTSGQHITRRDGGAPRPTANNHPTVKPTDLMRYLCRLVTPPSGVVLDPFMGSGSTLKAAELEGFSAIGIELDPEYIEIARRRIAADAPLFAEIQS